MTPKADYTIHSGWGDRISWTDTSEFAKGIGGDNKYRVNGHLPKRPKVGNTLLGEFEKSWVLFEFVEVELMRDPPDQFFGKVIAIERELK